MSIGLLENSLLFRLSWIHSGWESLKISNLVKPADLNALEGMMRTLKDFWLVQNTPLPD